MAWLGALVVRLGAIALTAKAACLGLGCSEQPRPGLPAPGRSGSASPITQVKGDGGAATSSVGSALPAEPAQPALVADGGPGKRRYLVAVVGDSLTDARSQGGKYLDLLRERCPQSRFDNYGVGGEMVNQMRKRFARDVLGDPRVPEDPKPQYTHVVVLGGINDICSDESAHRSNRKIERDLGAMYHAARERGMLVVALTMPPWGGFKRYYNERRDASTREVNDWIRRQAREGAVDSVLDVYPLLSCGQPSVLCSSYAWPDQVHWNAEGHRIVGEALYRAVFADCE